MKSLKKILLYDDEERFSEIIIQQLEDNEYIKGNYEVKRLDNNDFERELGVLEGRRKNYRNHTPVENNSVLDETSVFIIDYDLLKYTKSQFLTGENVAYLTRCYSECKYIIGLNQFNRESNFFDLTLQGHPESYCDLNLTSSEVYNVGLWSNKKDKFRPWHWPQLTQYLDSLDKRIKETEKTIDDSIIQTLGLDTVFKYLSKPALEFLGQDPETITFREFAKNSGHGLKAKDENSNDRMLVKIAVSRISKWIERLVYPGQDIIVDAPHLAERYPSLLKGSGEVEKWNKTTEFEPAQTLPLDHRKIEKYRFKKEYWLSRPAWFWLDLRNLSGILEVKSPWKRTPTERQFCEDSSTFEKKQNCQEFRAEVYSVYVQRFVNSPLIEGVNYQPRVRLMQKEN